MTDKNVLEDAFAIATELTGQDRQSFLDKFRGEHPQLADQLDALLKADADGAERVSQAVARTLEEFNTEGADPWVGRTLGAWSVVKRIGTGGMGAVFLAQRSGEFDQTAALKIMSAQLVRADAKARFEAERQILAQLRHPYIATLIDGGTDDVDLPYLVIEYVDGLAIDQYCDEHRLGLAARLDMVRKICAAVDYAHRNLVVHRDIKPSNILVDKDGNPKLLDFGIAKLLAAKDEPVLDQTEPQSRAWTPEYASPEQVRGEPISVATDVYALGVLLYRLLTDRSPFNQKATSRYEIESQIIDAEPEKPSNAVTRDTDESAPETASGSPLAALITPSTLQRKLRGDLDNIILKCLQKDPERRFGSARELSDDLGRYLETKPVLARRDSFVYRADKFVRRNVAPLAASLAGVLLLGGVIFTYTSLLAAERDAAELAAAEAEAMSDFMTSMFQSAVPSVVQGETLTARQVLDQSLKDIADLDGQPAVQAKLLQRMATAYAYLGDRQTALDTMQRAMTYFDAAPNIANADYVSALDNLGAIEGFNGKLDEARATLRKAVETIEPVDARSRVLQIRVLRNLGYTLYQLAETDDAIAKLSKAKKLSDEAVAFGDIAELGADEPDILDLPLVIIGDLAIALADKGRFDESLALSGELIVKSEEVAGELHPNHVIRIANHAAVLDKTGRYAAALQNMDTVFERTQKIWTPKNWQYSRYMAAKAVALAKNGRFDEGLDLAAQAVETVEQTSWNKTTAHTRILYNYAATLAEAGRLPAALEQAQKAVQIGRETGGERSPHFHMATTTLGMIKLKMEKCEGVAASMLETAQAEGAALLITRAEARMVAAGCASIMGDRDTAEAQFEAATKVLERKDAGVRARMPELLVLQSAHLERNGQPKAALSKAQEAKRLADQLLPPGNETRKQASALALRLTSSKKGS